MSSKFYLTTPIYYVNAKPHIGHAYTTLAADVIARYQKQKIGEKNVFFLTGTDEHGTKVAETAQKNNQSPQEFCDKMSPLFAKTWNSLNIKYNHFIRTSDDYHQSGAQEFLSILKTKGVLYQGDYKGLYCTGCENFLTEKQLDKQGFCPDHQTQPQKIIEKNWFFSLTKYLPRVQKLIENNKLHIEPTARRQEVLGLFSQNLDNFSISRPNVKWGIPLPWDKNQTIYVWVEALLNYWSAIFKSPITNYQLPIINFWPPDLHLIGKDIIKFHCIYWPAMLLAYFDGDSSQFPNKIFVHGFFTINSQKMSKTLGNVIDPNDLINEYGVDGARYLILAQFPFGADGDIEEIKFKEKYNADLANGIGNLTARVSALCLKQITDWNQFWQLIMKHETYNALNFEILMDDLRLYEILKEVMRQVKAANEYLALNQPWQINKDKNQEKIVKILAKAGASILSIADYLAPFLPQTIQEIKKCINIKNKNIKQGNSLFPRK